MGEENKVSASGSSAAVWDDAAVSYEAQREGDAIYRSCIRQTVTCLPRGTILCLDAGCGTGFASVLLAQRCCYLAAVDYSAASIEILRKKGIPNLSTFHADIRTLPFEDGLFDAAVCANTLQHLPAGEAQGQAVAELRRVTRAGGRLIVSVHHYSRKKRRAGWIKEGRPGDAAIDYIFRFTRRELAELMPQATIKGVGYEGLLPFPLIATRLQDFAATLYGRFAPFLGHGHMLVAVERIASRVGGKQVSNVRLGNCSVS